MSEDFVGKMDALDLIITALMEHEKRLDDVATRLEEAIKEEFDGDKKHSR